MNRLRFIRLCVGILHQLHISQVTAFQTATNYIIRNIVVAQGFNVTNFKMLKGKLCAFKRHRSLKYQITLATQYSLGAHLSLIIYIR